MNKIEIRTYNVINYFINNTEYCYKTKLFKLLFLYDFAHVKETGIPATNLNYFAWPKGPVPNELFSKIDTRFENLKIENDSFNEYFDIEYREYPGKKTATKLVPKKEFDKNVLTKRQFKLLCEIANKHKYKNTDEMIEFTHESDGPWDRVFKSSKYSKIPFYLAKKYNSEQEKKEALNKLNEYFETINF